ncbi:hypothetical protein BKA65DRAFT_575917 [Rhexocercosporidium sp. MPI-PUGE-AT-0058]|nr:hypothetical protein BKA65DRAFT_575917 [Rhexocercosporidium sp. MPI-PUGE-AT-0058]
MVVNQAELRDRVQTLAQRVATAITTENTVTYPLRVLPWPAYNEFSGRQEILTGLATQLGLHNYADRGSGDVRSVLLHGTGGVGKTQIARAFVHRNEAGFDAIFWVRSDTEVNIMTGFKEIALRLNLPGASRKRWLIIYDNCDNINDIYPKYIPTTKGFILITSRKLSSRLDDSNIIQVNPFDRINGLKLMKRLLYHNKGGENKVLSPSENKALQELLEKVDRLPLGIHVMVALMLPRMSAKQPHPIRNFSKYYSEHSRQLLIRAARSTDYDRDVDRTVGEKYVLDNVWHLSFTSLDSKALSVLGILSFFAPNDISMSWFDLGSKELVTTHKVLSVCKSFFEIECAIIELQGAALISKNDDDSTTDSDTTDSSAIMTPDTDSHTYSDLGPDSEGDSDEQSQPDSGIKSAKVSLHRLVQEAVIYSRSPSDRQAIFDAAISVMHEAFPKQDAYSGIWARHTGSTVAARGPDTSAEVVYLYETGNDTTALTLLDFTYQVIDRVGIDKTSEFYADLAYKAGSVYMDWGFLSRCREIWKEARSILEDKKAAGSESARHQLTWLWMAMANLEGAAGNHEIALELFSKSDEERLSDDTDNLWRHGITNLNTGRLHFFMGQHEKAVERYKECEKGFLVNSPTRAILDHALGNLEYAQCNIDLARTWYFEAVRGFESSGTNPGTLASCYVKLARLELKEHNSRLALKYSESITNRQATCPFSGRSSEDISRAISYTDVSRAYCRGSGIEQTGRRAKSKAGA